MPRPSILSLTCLTAASVIAAAGWLGVQVDGPRSGHAIAVAPDDDLTARRRAAWQPSPVPMPPGAPSDERSVASDVRPPVAVDDRRRAAWQPSPVPTPSSLEAGASTEPLHPARTRRSPGQASVTSPNEAPGVPVPANGIWSAFARLVDAAQGPSWEAGRVAVRAADHVPAVEPVPSLGATFRLYDDLFTTERLEALYGVGLLPESRGEWQYHQVPSLAVGESHQLLVWTPPGYETSGESYPTVYLLHGAGSATAYGADEWLGYGITEDLDRLIDSGFIDPMIVVLPFGAQGYWVNHADGGPQWSDYVTDEVVPYVDRAFRTDARRERRAIGGLSMGAHGALQISYRRPDLFAIAGAHSPTIRAFGESPIFFGDERHFETYDPLAVATIGPGAMRVTTWIDLGNEDVFLESTSKLRDALVARGAEVHFHVFEGEHEGWYWMGYLPEYLRFYSSALGAERFTAGGAPLVEADALLLSASAQPRR